VRLIPSPTPTTVPWRFSARAARPFLRRCAAPRTGCHAARTDDDAPPMLAHRPHLASRRPRRRTRRGRRPRSWWPSRASTCSHRHSRYLSGVPPAHAVNPPPNLRAGDSHRTRLTIYAVAAGLVVGAATSWAQTLLGSTALAGLANAVSPWLVAPFLIAAGAAGRRSAGMLGLLTCVAEVLGYYAAAAVRGFGVNPPTVAVWVVAGIAGGLVFGLAGHSWRTGTGRERGLGVALLVAVWLCEALVTFAIVLGYDDNAVVFTVAAVLLWLLLGMRGRQHLPALAWLVPAAGLGIAGMLALHALV
jgi:Family of unknown function (DUF6518)